MVFKRLRLLSVAVLSLLVLGCATHQEKTDEQVVGDLSQKRLSLLKAGDVNGAYALMSPGYRAQKTIEHFKMDFGGAANIVSFKGQSVSCEVGRCEVYVDVEYSRPAFSPNLNIVRTNIETWIKINDEWWYVRTQ